MTFCRRRRRDPAGGVRPAARGRSPRPDCPGDSAAFAAFSRSPCAPVSHVTRRGRDVVAREDDSGTLPRASVLRLPAETTKHCPFAGTLRADDGTRTHDLLHGKCERPFAPVRARSLKPPVCRVSVHASERERTRANAEPCHSCHGSGADVGLGELSAHEDHAVAGGAAGRGGKPPHERGRGSRRGPVGWPGYTLTASGGALSRRPRL